MEVKKENSKPKIKMVFKKGLGVNSLIFI